MLFLHCCYIQQSSNTALCELALIIGRMADNFYYDRKSGKGHGSNYKGVSDSSYRWEPNLKLYIKPGSHIYVVTLPVTFGASSET